MKVHKVSVALEKDRLPREDQLAWKLAGVAVDVPPIERDVAEMVVNRIIDNAAVASAALARRPVGVARAQARAHPRPGGATLFGLGDAELVDAQWAAWANGTAVRELDMHDTFLAADYAHPADSIPPILAVAEQCAKNGRDVLRAIVAAYEIHVSLVKGICLHKHKKDHIAHLCPAQAAGIGALLSLPRETIYQAIQHAVHVSFSTRQSRKGEISSWKAFAPAHAGKLAVEAVDRAMRGERSPSPIYEGEDSVIAFMLGGRDATYEVPLVEPGEPRRSILETYTKEHSAEYQSQALIDLAFRLRQRIADLAAVERITIHTSHHTHYVIGTGSGDPQKFDPDASRETLDHSAMYIFAVALEDGRWHHVESYAPERAHRKETVELWRKIETCEDPLWTAQYHHFDPAQKAFGGRVEVRLAGGEKISDEIRVADAHPSGRRPFGRADYIRKFHMLTEGIVGRSEGQRFIETAERLERLSPTELRALTVRAEPEHLDFGDRTIQHGIFR